MRRLTRADFNNSVRRLFGVTSAPADSWPADSMSTGFATDVSGQGATADLVDQQLRSAEAVAVEVVARLATVLPCSTQTTVTPLACGTRFIDEFGPRVFRRPLTAADRARLISVLQWGLGRGDLKLAARLVTTALLQSPHFLYRPEVGGTPEDHEGVRVVRVTELELASRFAFGLTRTTPSAALMDAALAGELSTAAGREKWGRALLSSPEGRETVAAFFSQWLHLDRIDEATKLPEVFPSFDAAMRQSMKAGTSALIDSVVFESPVGSLKELYTAPFAFVDRRTAPLYGLTGTFNDALVKADVSSQPRSGLLSDVGLMSALASERETSPVARGVFIWERLLCQGVPPPPPDLDIKPPPPDPGLTTRERFAVHRTSPACAGCHAAFDPPGFALENFDAVGRYRSTENGKPIDAVGTMTLQGVPRVFDGARDLGRLLGDEPQALRCFESQWFTYLFGRSGVGVDAHSLYALSQGEAATPIQQTLLTATTTSAFLYRPEVVVPECTP